MFNPFKKRLSTVFLELENNIRELDDALAGENEDLDDLNVKIHQLNYKAVAINDDIARAVKIKKNLATMLEVA